MLRHALTANPPIVMQVPGVMLQPSRTYTLCVWARVAGLGSGSPAAATEVATTLTLDREVGGWVALHAVEPAWLLPGYCLWASKHLPTCPRARRMCPGTCPRRSHRHPCG